MAEKPHEAVATAPDPEEDNLDDLDDVLDEFQATSISQPAPAPTTATTHAAPATSSGPGRPATEKSTTGESSAGKLPSEEDFAKDLQASMANLISELDQNPDMQKEFEKMMQELIAAGAGPVDAPTASTPAAATPASSSKAKAATATPSTSKKANNPEASFQDTIRKTMERMQASGDAATAASTSKKSASEDALLEQMMASLLEGSGAGAGGEGDFNSMLMSMMAQLTHKEILYEPMKELHDKFPAWMTSHQGKVAEDDMKRYQKQQTLVTEIVARFERPGYSDDNEQDRDYIVERMQEMQAAGSPPEDLVGDMSAAQEALGDLESGCPTQ